ncbi:hypothetical protein T484DRAFT_2182489 [Baffinella frigidus]|nr:hypothetical protein T484DRAFT_2182489 [Cryptophyta sp. CCMP2293]
MRGEASLSPSHRMHRDTPLALRRLARIAALEQDEHQQVVEDLVNDGLCHAASFVSTTTASPPRRRRQRPLPLENPSGAASCNPLEPFVRVPSAPCAVAKPSQRPHRPPSISIPSLAASNIPLNAPLVRCPSGPPAVAPSSPAHTPQPEGTPSGLSPHEHLLLAVATAKSSKVTPWALSPQHASVEQRSPQHGGERGGRERDRRRPSTPSNDRGIGSTSPTARRTSSGARSLRDLNRAHGSARRYTTNP